MSHYETLRVEPTATLEEIKKAYHQLALGTHPDKTPDLKEQARFLMIQAAYDILSDPEKRKAYDLEMKLNESSEGSEKAFPIGRDYRLFVEPYAYNHYEFTNLLFDIKEDSEEYLIPGYSISKLDKNRLWWQLHEVACKLHAERQRLERKYRKKIKEEEARLDLLTRNEDKIGQVRSILTTGEKEKLLYDLSLGPEVVKQSQEMLEIEGLIGGRGPLINLIKVNPDLCIARSIFALRDVGCLNPANFDRLAACRGFLEFKAVSSLIMGLFTANLLNPTNFDLAMTHKKHASTLSKGLLDLGFAGLLNQTSFEELLQCGEYAESAAFSLRLLKKYNLLNGANRKMVLELAKEMRIGLVLRDAFIKFDEQKLITPEDGIALQWTGDTEELHELSQRIDEMFAYGLFLLSRDEQKATTVFLLALDLKKSLKTFFEKPIHEQAHQQQQFKGEFLKLLRSQNTALAEHRAYWKVIVANIAIAFTGVGLLALGVYYAYSGHCFFYKTHREKLRDAIEESKWLQEGLIGNEILIVSC